MPLSVAQAPRRMARQARRLRLHRQLIWRHARQDQHPHQGNDAHSAAQSGIGPAVSGGGRRRPQRVDQPVEHRQDRQVQSGHEPMDAVRPADPRTESRYLSVLERPGQPLQVVVPYSRGRKVGVLTTTYRCRHRRAQSAGDAVRECFCRMGRAITRTSLRVIAKPPPSSVVDDGFRKKCA